MQGSMTIEITLLLPLLLCVFLLLYFTLYYLHDAISFEKACGVGLLRAAMERDPEQAKAKLIEATEEVRLLGRWEIAWDRVVTEETVSIGMEGTMFAREGLFRKYLPNTFALKMERSTDRIDEVHYIRSR